MASGDVLSCLVNRGEARQHATRRLSYNDPLARNATSPSQTWAADLQDADAVRGAMLQRGSSLDV